LPRRKNNALSTLSGSSVRFVRRRTADKKRPEDELAEERRKAVEATA
jgi:hypothetical protein